MAKRVKVVPINHVILNKLAYLITVHRKTQVHQLPNKKASMKISTTVLAKHNTEIK